MTVVVLDSSVIVSACGWRADAYVCLVAFARRRFRAVTSAWILEETSRALARLLDERSIEHDPWPIFSWFRSSARIVVPTPTGKQRSRDADDDPVLGTALAASARIIVTLDHDLLALGKPFGIEMITPRQLLARLQRPI